MFQKFLLLVCFFTAGSLFAATAPDFTVTDSKGKTHNLYADYVNQGKVVVLEIFFINCPPCNTHAPYWQSLFDSLKSDYPGQVSFLMLSDKAADNNVLVEQYRSSKGLTMPAVGSDGGSLTAVQPYKDGLFGPFYGTPTFVIITPGTGEVIYDLRGGSPTSTMDKIQQEVEKLLEVPQCHIQTPKGDTLQNYGLEISVPGDDPVFYQVNDGVFSLENFPGLPNLPFYEMQPFKNDNPVNGVSTFDLVQINRQILGVVPFQHPWQFIAADANNSGTLTTFDIVELRKLILGIYDSLPVAPSWVFSPALDSISNQECPEFLAIKKGDVDGNADPSGLATPADRNADHFYCQIENRRLNAGETYEVNFYTTSPIELLGLQSAFLFDPFSIEIQDVFAPGLSGFDKTCWYKNGGRLTLSWQTGLPIDRRSGGSFFKIKIRALQNVDLAAVFVPETRPLTPELYDANGVIHQLEWQYSNAFPGQIALSPNPAREFTILSVGSASSESATVDLFSMTGKLAWRQPIKLESGMNQVEIRPGQLSSGIYVVRVGDVVVGKLVWQGK